MTPSIQPGKYPRGTYSKVARKLGIKPQTVRLVALGKMTSARVMSALRAEARLARRRKSAATDASVAA
jgi:hypothetical protein